jgi:hypothetical protein
MVARMLNISSVRMLCFRRLGARSLALRGFLPAISVPLYSACVAVDPVAPALLSGNFPFDNILQNIVT